VKPVKLERCSEWFSRLEYSVVHNMGERMIPQALNTTVGVAFAEKSVTCVSTACTAFVSFNASGMVASGCTMRILKAC
jgi:hypothetical protein